MKCTAYSSACLSCPPADGDAAAASSASRLPMRTVPSAVNSWVEPLLEVAVPLAFGAGIVFTELDRDRVDVEADARGAV